MLQRQIVVWLRMADGANDAGLAIGQPSDRNAGRLAQRRQAALRGDHQTAVADLEIGISGYPFSYVVIPAGVAGSCRP